MDYPVLIIAAVADELSGLREQLRHLSVTRKVDKTIVRGELAGHIVDLMETGPGQINTARALTAAIENEKPALVIQTGCAGVFAATGLALGDIGIASQEIDVQLGIEDPEDAPIVSPLPFHILKRENTRIRKTYPVSPNLTGKTRLFLKQTFASAGVKVSIGPFITVSTITASDWRAEKYYRKYKPLMENMEGTAAAHVCIHYDIPFLEIRSASNRVGRRDIKEWNLPLAFRRASQAVYAVVGEIASGNYPEF